MSASPSILAVTHEASYTGAPINLLHLLSWIRSETNARVHTLVLRDGPIRERFGQVGGVTRLPGGDWRHLLGPDLVRRPDRPAADPLSGLATAGRSMLSGALRRLLLRQLGDLPPADLVYVNSTEATAVLELLEPARPVVLHAHEMGVALELLTPRERELLCTVPSRVIAASEVVCDELEDLGVDRTRIRVHHEFIDTAPFTGHQIDLRETERLRRQVRIPDDAAIVMGAGAIEWRKGVDLFVQLAATVRRRTREPVYFVWVGGDPGGLEWRRAWADCRRAGVRDIVRFVGTHPHPQTWFAAADVFALTSHEDPFPLVCLEHAAMRHPVVTFRNGGTVELLEAAGAEARSGVVHHLDVEAMAERILMLLDSEALRATVGDQLQKRVLDHHDVLVAAPKLWADVEELL